MTAPKVKKKVTFPKVASMPHPHTVSVSPIVSKSPGVPQQAPQIQSSPHSKPPDEKAKDVSPLVSVSESVRQEGELPTISELDRRNEKQFIIGTGLVVLIVLCSVGTLGLIIKIVPQGISVGNKPTPAIPAIPTPTPIFNRSQVTIEVLNGSGIAGMAAKAATKLNALGYELVLTGNADKSTYKATTVSITTGFRFSKELMEDLDTAFGVSTPSGELADSTASARIIIGR